MLKRKGAGEDKAAFQSKGDEKRKERFRKERESAEKKRNG